MPENSDTISREAAKNALCQLCRDISNWRMCERKDECNLICRIDGVPAAPKWIPVTERLPSNGTNVLVFEFGRVEQAYTTTYTADRRLCWVVINGGSYHRISDADCPIKWWMPLPQPPKEDE